LSNYISVPHSLLERVIDLLDGLDDSSFGYNFCSEYAEVLRSLKLKINKFELRKAYARIVLADDDVARLTARIDFLRLKQLLLSTVVDDDCPF